MRRVPAAVRLPLPAARPALQARLGVPEVRSAR